MKQKLSEFAPMEALSMRSCGSSSPWRRLWAWMDIERQDLWTSVAYATAVGLLTLASPLAVQSLFNNVAFGTLTQPLLVLSVILAVALGISAFFNGLQLLLVEHIGRRVFLRTAMDFATRLPLVRSRLGTKDLDELSNRFIDVVLIEKATAKIVFDGVTATLQISVGLMLLAVYHPYLLAFDLLLIAAMLFIIFVMGRGAVPTAIQESKKKYVLFAWLQDVAKNTLSFRSSRGVDYAAKRTTELAETWLGARQKHFGIFFRQVVGMYTVQVAATTLLLALGGLLVLDQQLSLGQLVAAELMIALTVGSLTKIGSLFKDVYDLIAALDKVGNVLDLETQDLDGEELSDDDRGIALEVRMAELDLELAAGEKKLLCATERPQSLSVIDGLIAPSTQPRGTLRIEEIDAHDLAVDSLHEQVMVLRPGSLFPGSVRDNVTLGDRVVDRSTVSQSLAVAGIEETVERLSEGMATTINRVGYPLHPNDQARLLLARAFALRPRLLIVDRVFDALGVKERESIIEKLFGEEMPWTVLYLTAHGSDHYGGSKQEPLREVVAS